MSIDSISAVLRFKFMCFKLRGGGVLKRHLSGEHTMNFCQLDRRKEKQRVWGCIPQELFLMTMAFALAINVVNALFSTTEVHTRKA